jgi:hypothetical protein
MSDDKLDLSAYDQAVARNLLFGLARSRAFDDRVAGSGASVDPTRGTIAFATLGAFPAQILGTWAHDSDTFLWSWANPGAPSWKASIGFAEQLRDRGQREPGWAVFTERKISPQWVHPIELGLVVSDLIGAPLFTLEAGQATALLVVGKAGLESLMPNPVHLVSLLDGAREVSALPARALVAPFLARLGFSIERAENEVSASRAGTSVKLTFDEHGRFTRLDGHFGA